MREKAGSRIGQEKYVINRRITHPFLFAFRESS
jgi:hypothetical protein